ncbi:hypothetical protein LIER_19154 [Lithospermum erythrorhizon]|uniref:Uncharacterized protein n=1 Tax=Lithospermum erythrorhizon TaxID=34254 RepID=A0AAV3QM51_LITER
MNKQADALTGLAASLTYPGAEIKVPVCKKWVMGPLFEAQEYEEGEWEESMVITTTSGAPVDWRQPLIDYLQHGRLPEYPPEEEAAQAMNEAHSGVCGAHQFGAKFHFQIKRMGYNWHTMFHANFTHQPPEPLYPMTASWLFDSWGMDMIRPMPESVEGHIYILAATDYFSNGSVQQDSLQYREECATPNALVYGVEAVLPLEVQIPSLRMSLISKSYNNKVCQWSYQVGDMVLAVKRPIYTLRKNEKMVPKWDGPYMVQEVYTSESYLLADQEGLKVGPINGRYLKKYYS